MKTPNICVVGSINMDMTTTASVAPVQGETVLGEAFATYPGGKGANQAVAAARLGANVAMIGAVGKDAFGQTLLTNLQHEGIDTSGVMIANDVATGVANIVLSENDNRIIVVPGANFAVTPAYVAQQKERIRQSDIVLLQFEIPMETIIYTAKLAKEYEVPVIINPAPFQALPDELLESATYLTPNEIEMNAILAGQKGHTVKEKMIVTLGEKGVRFFHQQSFITAPGYAVEAIDTTGAGDTFNGALAVGIGQGQDLKDAIDAANAAAALSVTKIGAQNGMPTKQQRDRFIADRKRE